MATLQDLLSFESVISLRFETTCFLHTRTWAFFDTRGRTCECMSTSGHPYDAIVNANEEGKGKPRTLGEYDAQECLAKEPYGVW